MPDDSAHVEALRDLVHDDELAARGGVCVPLVEDLIWTGAGADDRASLPTALRAAVAVAAADRVARILRQLVADRGRSRVLRYSARHLQREILAALQREQDAEDGARQTELVRTAGDAVRADIWRLLEELRRRPQTQPLPDYLPFTADRVEQGMVEAICRVHDWQREVVVLDKAGRSIAFAHAFESRTPNFRMVVGFPRPMDDLVDALASNDTYALKLLHVMWARWFEQAGGDPNRWARVSFSQLCQDLFLVRHHKGGFRPEQRARVADTYDAVSQLEMYAEYSAPGGDGTFALRGPLWDGRLAAIRQRRGSTSSDLFWRPGPFFGDPSWRADNPYLGHLSRRLLQLDRREKWATRLGTDYAMLARHRRNSPQFRSQHEVVDRVRHILERTGLDQCMPSRPAMQQRLFEDAHDQLAEIGVLVGHGYGSRPAENWRNRDKILRFPHELAGLPGQLKLPLAAIPPRRLQ